MSPFVRAGPATSGLDVTLAGIALGDDRTAIQLTAWPDSSATHVYNAGGWHGSRRPLVLRDDRGQEYTEIPSNPPSRPYSGSVYTDDILFSALSPGAKSIELDVPFVTVAEQAAAAPLEVPLTGRRVGDTIVLPTTNLMLGRYPIQVTSASLGESDGQRQLVLHLDLGSWHDGRKLVAPGRVQLEGFEPSSLTGLTFFDAPDVVGQSTEVRIPLREDVGDRATVLFRDAQVAVQGPWRLRTAVQGSGGRPR